MNHARITLLFFAFLILSWPATAQEESRRDQVGVSLKHIPVPGKKGEFYLGQRTRSDLLKLSANEVFFPALGLTAVKDGDKENNELALNQKKSFGAITGWDVGEEAEWGIFLENTGKLRVSMHQDGLALGLRFECLIGGKALGGPFGKSIADSPDQARVAVLEIEKAGFHVVRLKCTQRPENGKVMLPAVYLEGPAASGASVLRKRWRPKAAHARFSCSKKPEGVHLWIFEMDAAPGTLGFYSPMTTPFGYYGSTWLADGRVNKSINFSLWSFGRGKKAPPVEKLSHLLAVGDPDATFSGFSHEGTGVKIRGWDPFEGRQGQRQVFAARVEHGEVYDTYYSYFWAADEKRWRLFGAGRKVKAKRTRPFFPGSFVEVPGRAEKQRTGAYKRRMRYRGWVFDKDNKIHVVDRMSYADVDKKTGLTYTDRGTTDDGRFFLETGGWVFRKASAKKKVALKPIQTLVAEPYLLPAKTKMLLSIPSAVRCTKLERQGEEVIAHIEVTNGGESGEVTAFWGAEEALTFADRWQNKKVLKTGGKQSFTMRLATENPSRPFFLRLFLKNEEGQFWSMETMTLAE